MSVKSEVLGIFSFDNAVVNKFHISVAYHIVCIMDLKVLGKTVQVILNGTR